MYIYIYIYNKTNIKRNILTIKQNTSGSRSGITFGVCAWPRTHTKRYAAALPQITSTI